MSGAAGAKPVHSEEFLSRSEASRKGWTPEARAKASASGKKRWAKISPEERSERIKVVVNRLEVKKKLVQAQARLKSDPEVIAHKSEGRKKQWNTEAGFEKRELMRKKKKAEWADPDKAKQMIDAMNEGNSRSEARENRSAAMKEVSSRPGVANGRRERMKNWWATATPEQREQRIAAMHAADSRPEVNERRIATLRRTLAKPEVQQRRSAL